MANILVVDDDEIFRIYLVTVLQKAGYTVLEAENGQAALDLVGTMKIDLIITDIFMPKMDGIDLLAAVLAEHPNARMIAISGGYKAMNSKLTLEMAQSFGALEIITKPFHAETVLQKVQSALATLT
ncbi:Chemotaxis protein CheY [Candidatus Magnetaquicoccaceae bacterium FCR-1]|uniref:Chemotaxis protein CheY n=1 Tax=Candidatus Magnetaquiglobus chichijimensis TaxID=3141448 RepID=A0ABQ0C7N0_9PROT